MQNEKGQIAIKRFRQQPYVVSPSPDKSYLFTPNKGVCLAWVDPEDVDTVLATKRHCCSTEVQQFYLANEEDVRIHGG